MHPFRYPESTHSRTQAPGLFADYRRYKPFLRLEFQRQCVYCRLPDGLKGEDAFGVDHYRPVALFPEVSSDYGNLFYSCNSCNRRKRDFWPTREQWSRGAFLPNPCDHTMSEHLQFSGTLVHAASQAGTLAIDLLMLNESEAILFREFILRSIDRCLTEAASILELLVALGPRLQRAKGPDREDIQRDIDKLRANLSQVDQDFERLTGTRLPGPSR